MCANYRPATRELMIARGYNVLDSREYAPEVYPGGAAPFVRAGAENVAEVGCLGLLPHFAKGVTFSRHTYNARSETVAQKPSFRTAWAKGQFAVAPMIAFYEPRYAESSKKSVRWRIERTDGELFGAAAIWNAWRSPSGEWVLSFALLTIAAAEHSLMRDFHSPDDEKRSIVRAYSEFCV
jgi:putative SOS response-associated peptidase YedK